MISPFHCWQSVLSIEEAECGVPQPFPLPTVRVQDDLSYADPKGEPGQRMRALLWDTFRGVNCEKGVWEGDVGWLHLEKKIKLWGKGYPLSVLCSLFSAPVKGSDQPTWRKS